MPQSFVCLNCYVIFSTKGREPLIMPAWAARLYDYIGGIARKTGNTLLAAGGTADHVHLLVSVGKEASISSAIRDLKSNSSRWIHDSFDNLRGFTWQVGYGAFAVSHSNLDEVKRCVWRPFGAPNAGSPTIPGAHAPGY